MTDNYLQVLRQYGLDFTEHGPWATVGKSVQIQGWKLHLSSIPIEAVKLLKSVIPILLRYGVSFKIATSEKVLAALNEGELGATQVGKFATVYPDSDGQAKHLSNELVDATKSFNGPEIVTDLHIGGVVYARYGGFNPVIVRDRLGQLSLCIYGLDGNLQSDSYRVPFVAPEGVSIPFSLESPYSKEADCLSQIPISPLPSKNSKIFGPGYLIIEVIQQHPKGSVFRAIDLRSQEQVSLKVIKQGRQFCLSDEYGRDIRARLRHQETLHNTLSGLLPIPVADPYFEVRGNGYLPLQNIDGQSIESFTYSTLQSCSWHSLALDQKIKTLSYLKKLIVALQKMHSYGYIHRDITASNVWIGSDNEVYLLDLELAHAVDNPAPAFTMGTPGFMSPDQESRKPPKFEDDVYSLGCVLVLVFTGLDPRRVLFAGSKNRVSQLLQLTNLPLEVVEIIAKCLSKDYRDRPTLQTILTNLIGYESLLTEALKKSETLRQQLILQSHGYDAVAIDVARKVTAQNRQVDEALMEVIMKAQHGLLEDVAVDPVSGLWLSPSLDHTFQWGNQRNHNLLELRRSTNRGVAGIVYVLSRLARFRDDLELARVRVQEAIQWLLEDESVPDANMPGLHFGDAGVAVAIAEAICAGIIDRNKQTDAFIVNSLSQVPDWPDVTHGAAGQGIAVIYCADRLQDTRLLDLVHKYTKYLTDTQKQDGSWEIPPGVEGMSGEILTGFAHGVSGIVYFLAEYTRRFEADDVQKAWQAGAQWLVDNAISTNDGQTLEWTYSNTHSDRWKWWCHGSPGIALTFLRLYEQTGNISYAEIATRALEVHPYDIQHPNLSQCHGLSGLGEIYLEASRVLGSQYWYSKAAHIADFIYNLRRESERSVTWLVEEPHAVTADLMVGSGGVLHFLLRYFLKGQYASYPLLLDPIHRVSPE